MTPFVLQQEPKRAAPRLKEGIDAVSDVIYHLETYDVTTIRAGTPMFLLARKIKAMGVKMVMSGEGADETFAGKPKARHSCMSVPHMESPAHFVHAMSTVPGISLNGMQKACYNPCHTLLLMARTPSSCSTSRICHH